MFQMFSSVMTKNILPPDIFNGLKPEFIAPLVGVLTAKNASRYTERWTLIEVSDDHSQGPDVSGRTFELGAGFFSELRWERSRGK